jgi:hypothetical protein
MNTPGFTAHESLYRSNRHYVTALASSWNPPAAVVAAFKVPPNGECHKTCGACSNNCQRTCQNSCLPTPTVESCCGSGETCCSGDCVTTASDSANCGSCGHACPSGKVCSHGVCGCPSGLTECGGKCVDLGYDPLNCGSCGTKCTGSSICCGGTCGGTICSDGGCCPKGQPCCNTPLGIYCCSNQCLHTPFGNVCV